MSYNIIIDHFKDVYKMLLQNSQETMAAAQIFAAFFGAVIGGWTGTIQIFIILIGLDYFAGILRAVKTGKLNSTAGWLGIVKKMGYFVVIAMFFQVGLWIGSSTADAMFVRTIVVNMFIVNELVSILENVKHLGDEDYLPHGVIEMLETIIADDVRQKLKLDPLPGSPDSE